MAEIKSTVRLTPTDRLNVRVIAKYYSTTTAGAIRLGLAELARRLLREKDSVA